MAKYSGPKSPPVTAKDAMQIAMSIQRPGQTKEQTRLIARGIEQGIEQYKKREKAKSKERARRVRKASTGQVQPPNEAPNEVIETVRYRQHWLPWALLALTWLGIGAALLVLRSG